MKQSQQTRGGGRRSRRSRCVLLLAVGCVSTALASDPPSAVDASTGSPAEQLADLGSRQSYPAASLALGSAATATDLLRRIPGAEFLLRDSPLDEVQERGLTGSATRLLINGRPVTAKSQDARRLLDRIDAEDVVRVDVLISSTAVVAATPAEPAIDIILRSSEKVGGRWEVALGQSARNRPRPAGKLVVSGQRGDFDYALDAEVEGVAELERGRRWTWTPDGTLAESVQEQVTERGREWSIGGNAVWNLQRMDLGVNTLLSEQRIRESDLMEARGPSLVGGSGWLATQRQHYLEREWEIASDLEVTAGEADRFEIATLYREEQESSRSQEIDAVDGARRAVGREQERQTATEAILRGRWRRALAAGDWVSAGVEVSRNTLETTLDVQELEDGRLVPREVSNAEQTVEELRLEPFLIGRWSLSPWLAVLAEVKGERTRLTQRGSDVRQSRDDHFLLPRLELRAGLTPQLSLEVGVQWTVSQLDFGDFAASFDSRDREVNAGNPDLEPERALQWHAGLERRLADEQGRLGLRLFHHAVRDVLDEVPGPEGSRPGNLSKGERYGFAAEAAFLLDVIGLPNAKLELTWQRSESEVLDPFTAEVRSFRDLPRDIVAVDFRHDVESFALAYGMTLEYESRRRDFDDTEVEHESEGLMLDAFVERQLAGNFRLRLAVDNLLDSAERRRTSRFEPRRSTGAVPNEIETERFREGRALRITLAGQF